MLAQLLRDVANNRPPINNGAATNSALFERPSGTTASPTSVSCARTYPVPSAQMINATDLPSSRKRAYCHVLADLMEDVFKAESWADRHKADICLKVFEHRLFCEVNNEARQENANAQSRSAQQDLEETIGLEVSIAVALAENVEADSAAQDVSRIDEMIKTFTAASINDAQRQKIPKSAIRKKPPTEFDRMTRKFSTTSLDDANAMDTSE